jgi:hypothetical protein
MKTLNIIYKILVLLLLSLIIFIQLQSNRQILRGLFEIKTDTYNINSNLKQPIYKRQ